MQLPKQPNFSRQDIEAFKSEVLQLMKDMGATEDDFAMFNEDGLLTDIVITAMVNKQKPKDVAWAVLQ